MSEWISVKDRLPKASDAYYAMGDVVWLISFKGEIRSVALPWWENPRGATRWQPLPEPPKECDT